MFKKLIQLVTCLIFFLTVSTALFAEGSEQGSTSGTAWKI